MIRKSGLIIFLVVATIICLTAYLFAGTGLRLAMIYSLEKAARAEVNIRDVSLGLAPLSLKVTELQITDRKQPELNLISFDEANATLALWPALMGYYVADELSVQGLAYQSPRATEGEVYNKDKGQTANAKDDTHGLSDALNLNVPNAEDVMAKVDLQTVAKGEALQTIAEKEQQQLKQIEKALPEKKQLEAIKAKIEALSQQKIQNAQDLASKTAELKQLKEQLEKERDKLKQAKTSLSSSRDNLQTAVKELRAAAESDWEKIERVANIKDGGIAGITQMLLGDVWAERITQLQAIYRMVEPYIPEGSNDDGDDANEFERPNRILPLPRKPYPSFWIKKANIDWTLGESVVALNFQNITGEHHIIDAPTTFQANAERLAAMQALNLNGEISIEQHLKSNVDWSVDGLKLEPQTFGGGNQLLLEQGQANINGQLNLVNKNIQQEAELTLVKSQFKGTGSSALQKLAQILNNEPKLSANIKTTGTIFSPKVSVRSGLDQVIGDAIFSEAKQKAKALEKELRADLDAKLKEQLSGNDELLQALNTQGADIEKLNSIIESALKAKLQSVEDQAKDKAKTKAKDKLKDKLGDKLLKFGD